MQRPFLLTRRSASAVVALILCGTGVATSQTQVPRAATGAAATGAGGLWISDSPLEDGRRLLIVVDPATRHAAVYHVDPASGTLTLKSARDIGWDLSIDEFNVQEPRPAALKKMLQSPPTPGP